MRYLAFFYNVCNDCTYFAVPLGLIGLVLMALMQRYRPGSIALTILIAFNCIAAAIGLRYTKFSPRYIIICGILFLVGCGGVFDVLHKRWRHVFLHCVVVGLFAGGMIHGVAKCCRFKPRDIKVFEKLGRSLADLREDDYPMLCLAQSHHFNRVLFHGGIRDDGLFKIEDINKDFSSTRADMEKYFQQSYNSLSLFFKNENAEQQQKLIENIFPETCWERKISYNGYSLWFARNNSRFRGRKLSAPMPAGREILSIGFTEVGPLTAAEAQKWNILKTERCIRLQNIPEEKFFPGITPNPGHGFPAESPVLLKRLPQGGLMFSSTIECGFVTQQLQLSPGKYSVSMIYDGERGGRIHFGSYKTDCFPRISFHVLDRGLRRGDGVFELKHNYNGFFFIAMHGNVRLTMVKLIKLS